MGEVVRQRSELSEDEPCGVAPIHALVITDNTGLVPHIRFSLPGNRLLVVRLEYEGITIRCSHCLSYSHFVESCIITISNRKQLGQPATITKHLIAQRTLIDIYSRCADG